jgi:hypothetical protein
VTFRCPSECLDPNLFPPREKGALLGVDVYGEGSVSVALTGKVEPKVRAGAKRERFSIVLIKISGAVRARVNAESEWTLRDFVGALNQRSYGKNRASANIDRKIFKCRRDH